MHKNSFNNIFGDDGFRCKYGEKYLTKKFLNIFAYSLAIYFKKKYKNPKCVIGIDTRWSGPKIFEIISKQLRGNNIEVVYCGVIPSPGISYILKKFKFNFGIMITASHNSFEDNGVKLFASNGFKLKTSDEKNIEILIKKNLNLTNLLFTKNISKIQNYDENLFYKNIYTDFLKEFITKTDIKTKILIDCSNGASSFIFNKIFNNKKNVKIINDKPNGKNINLNCGALYPKKLQKILIKKNYDFGIALDGDSDRCILVDKKKGLLDPEKIIFLYLELLSSNKTNNIICSSEIVNKSLEFNLKNIRYSLFETNVGDRNVVNLTRNKNALLGFEPSGHYYFPNFNNSMDGNIATILIVKYLEKKPNIKNYLKLKSHKRVINNIKIKDLGITLKEIRMKIKEFKLRAEEKLLVRESIWEPIYRIYYDYEGNNRFNIIKKHILNK